jgi:hypothetical protein
MKLERSPVVVPGMPRGPGVSLHLGQDETGFNLRA